MKKYYITGVVVSITLGLFLTLVCIIDYHTCGLTASDGVLLKFLLYCLPGGLLAGYIGGWLEKKYPNLIWGTVVLTAGTIVLSIFFSMVSWCGFNDCLF